MCRTTDPELFFPEGSGGAPRAKRICGVDARGNPLPVQCPVIEQCLIYSLVNKEQHGIWGGLSYRERMALRHKLGLMDSRGRKSSASLDEFEAIS